MLPRLLHILPQPPLQDPSLFVGCSHVVSEQLMPDSAARRPTIVMDITVAIGTPAQAWPSKNSLSANAWLCCSSVAL